VVEHSLICLQLKNAFPWPKDLHIIHETIYQALYIRGGVGLSTELVECLCTGRDRHKSNRSFARRSSRFAGGVLLIGDRAEETGDRSRVLGSQSDYGYAEPFRDRDFSRELHPIPDLDAQAREQPCRGTARRTHQGVYSFAGRLEEIADLGPGK
jgi:hypothetical protein